MSLPPQQKNLKFFDAIFCGKKKSERRDKRGENVLFSHVTEEVVVVEMLLVTR